MEPIGGVAQHDVYSTVPPRLVGGTWDMQSTNAPQYRLGCLCLDRRLARIVHISVRNKGSAGFVEEVTGLSSIYLFPVQPFCHYEFFFFFLIFF